MSLLIKSICYTKIDHLSIKTDQPGLTPDSLNLCAEHARRVFNPFVQFPFGHWHKFVHSWIKIQFFIMAMIIWYLNMHIYHAACACFKICTSLSGNPVPILIDHVYSWWSTAIYWSRKGVEREKMETMQCCKEPQKWEETCEQGIL